VGDPPVAALRLEPIAAPVFRRAVRTSLPGGTRLPADLQGELWDCFRRPEVRAFVARMCAGYQGTLPRLAEQYASLAVPTLLLWGERDRHFPPAQARQLCERVRAARLEVVPGGEHWMAWHAPEAVAARVLEFLQANPAAARGA
jgi:pimeloyl-ACP methyl ester carboxylesterase